MAHVRDQYEAVGDLAAELARATDNRFISNPFQCYATARIVASKQRITVATLPPGSGKTYLAALIAMNKK